MFPGCVSPTGAAVLARIRDSRLRSPLHMSSGI
ncbi:hypothetical protein chiPu_0025831, partial [Chiloscyllium punctatum]|nr:hypothetical protein [Chiloscyllium punctatum]